ncbi:peptidylprolyl isomerase [Labilibacter sediminis]|nr:peptidylprolyl isomerase [Labilibacter sediminis]
MNWIKIVVFAIAVLVFNGCQQNSSKQNISKEEYSIPKGSYQRNIKGVVSIETFDHYSRSLKRGYGFYISPKTLVTNLDLIKGSYKVKVAIVGTDDYNEAAGYTAYDIDKNLVILKTWTENLNYLHLDRSIKSIPDSIAGLYRKSRKIYAPKFAVDKSEKQDSIKKYRLSKGSYGGQPAFTYLHHLLGIIQTQKEGKEKVSYLVPSSEIMALSKKQMKEPVSVYELRTKTNKVYPSYKSIKGFRIKTSMGNIDIKLYNQTPKFRDNFIKLVSDQFYDSLLVHRVLKNFLIQTGAADSKYAAKDDVVGWQGPGYMLETNVVPGLFHKRGAVAASKLPPERNPKDRSDGSQFYIVAGRVFNAEELKDIEKEKGIKFTQKQIATYGSVGGAPHLDGDYTVFGEVTRGMDVVDKIAGVKTYAVDRPVKDIRVYSIEILK